MRKRAKASLTAAGLGLAAAGWLALSGGEPRPAVARVVLLGFDGASPQVIEELAAQGRLPALKRLMQAGSYGPLQTVRPTKSSVLWTSVATGKTMLKHGIVDWTYVNREGLQVPYQDRARRARTYWEILSGRGIRTGTVNWWVSYPPRAIPAGYIVSNAFRHRQEPGTVHPPALFERLKGLILQYPQEVPAEMQRRGFPQWREEEATVPLFRTRNVVVSYGLYFAQDVTVDRVSDYLWDNEPVQVFSTYFRLVDVTSHLAGHYLDRPLLERTQVLEDAGALGPADRERIDRDFARVVAPAYELMDRTVAKYLDRQDGRTVLIVCSDHGFQYFKGAYGHAFRAMEPPPGVLFLAGPGVKRGHRIAKASLYDIAPSILHWMGLPAPQGMDGRVLAEALEEGFRSAHPVRTVASYEREDAPPHSRASGKTAVDQDVLEDLKALGYIQAPPEP